MEAIQQFIKEKVKPEHQEIYLRLAGIVETESKIN
jgi:hypothetical protein